MSLVRHECTETATVKPFLKWTGGKRWLASVVSALLGNARGRYIEPFVGSGACFFKSSPQQALLADANRHLIACYRIVRDRPEQLIRDLARLDISASIFYRLRQDKPSNDLARATRLLYLNRTSFNGIYRVNRKGEFNVPFGCKPSTTLCDAHSIRACSDRLANVELLTADFRTTLRLASCEDCVYLDPPFTVMHNDNAFRRYNEHIFSWDDQCALANVANNLACGGARVVISNALHADVKKLYNPRVFNAFAVSRSSNMAADPECRGACLELLLVSRTIASGARSVRRLLEGKSSGISPRVFLKHMQLR